MGDIILLDVIYTMYFFINLCKSISAKTYMLKSFRFIEHKLYEL